MKKVLLVDDSPASLELTRALLMRPRVSLLTANSGAEALRIHRQERVDLILMDLLMPGLDGDRVCRMIRSDPALRQVSVVMVSVSNKPEDRARALAAGANAYLTKPVSRSELLRTLYRFLNVAPRMELSVPVQLQRLADPEAEVVSGTTVNISVSGMLADVGGALEVGSAVVCNLQLPHVGAPLVLASEVVRCEPRVDTGASRCAMRFLRADAEGLQALERLVGGVARV